jgi:hypothetical protein
LLTSLLDELDQRIAQLKEEAAQKPLLPKGAGEIIMNHFGIPPGPVVGRLKKALEEAIAEERVPADLPVEEYLGFLQDLIRSSSN